MKLILKLLFGKPKKAGRPKKAKKNLGPVLLDKLAGGALALLPVLTLTSGPPRLGFPATVWCASAATGIFCTWLAFVCYGESLKRISLVRAVIISELEPVLSMLWVWLAFGERFGPLGQLGSALIIASVLALSLGKEEE